MASWNSEVLSVSLFYRFRRMGYRWRGSLPTENKRWTGKHWTRKVSTTWNRVEVWQKTKRRREGWRGDARDGEGYFIYVYIYICMCRYSRI